MGDCKTRSMVTGVACPWYSGDHFENLDLIRDTFPELKLIISESCIEYNKFDKSADTVNAVCPAHEILGDMNHGVSAFYDWNLLLDQYGRPNHVGNFCHAPFLFDTNAKTLHPQLLDYFSLCARAVRPGSVRLVCSRYTDACDAVAYHRPDGRFPAVSPFISARTADTNCTATVPSVRQAPAKATTVSAITTRLNLPPYLHTGKNVVALRVLHYPAQQCNNSVFCTPAFS